MCGIGGYLGPESKQFRQHLGAKMTAELHHRGPDASDVTLTDGLMLAHTRLSILDLSELGSQPMASADGRYLISYNGELFNFPEIRAELESLGRTFVSRSDTEVVLQALIQWGADALPRFNGMFALAFWDKQEQSLLLARDRFGIKPLFYSHTDQGLLFASEVNTLANTGLLSNKLSLKGLHEYLFFGNALGESTLLEYCQKLPGGTWMEAQIGKQPVIKQFWHSGLIKQTSPSETDAVEHIQLLLKQSVKRHLLSDVPVGLFLSGGLDSSTICALASQQLDTPLSTYSVAFEGMTAHSELAVAREVANRFNTTHTELSVSWQNLEQTIETLTQAHGQPFGDAANLPLYLLTKELPANIKVVLQGDGGDEVFGGYRRYRLLRYAKLCGLLTKLPFSHINFPFSNSFARRAQRLLGALGEQNNAHRCAWLLTEEPSALAVNSLLKREIREALPELFPVSRYEQILDELPENVRSNPQQSMLWTDMQILLADYFLEKVDRSTMANSVEIRVPFLDTPLCDYVMGLPAELKLTGQSKQLLRKAMSDKLPKSVLSGPKYGFGVPYVEWLRGPLSPYVESRFFDSNSLFNELFDRASLAALWQEFKQSKNNRGFMIYKLLVLAIWLDQYAVSL